MTRRNITSKLTLFAAFTCLFLCLTLNTANAFRVSPMVYDLAPSGPAASKTIRVQNTTEDKLPVEIYAEKRVIHADGSESREPADDDFLIFPPQAIIDANGVQAVRVQYIGDPSIKNSAGYVVTVAQIPVDLKNLENSGVQFTFQFGTSVNVVPSKAKAKIEVLETKPAEGGVDLHLKNSGNSYTRLSLGQWIFSNNEGKQVILEGNDLKEAISQPLIQPNTERNITLPLPDDWDKSQVQAEFVMAP